MLCRLRSVSVEDVRQSVSPPPALGANSAKFAQDLPRTCPGLAQDLPLSAQHVCSVGPEYPACWAFFAALPWVEQRSLIRRRGRGSVERVYGRDAYKNHVLTPRVAASKDEVLLHGGRRGEAWKRPVAALSDKLLCTAHNHGPDAAQRLQHCSCAQARWQAMALGQVLSLRQRWAFSSSRLQWGRGEVEWARRWALRVTAPSVFGCCADPPSAASSSSFCRARPAGNTGAASPGRGGAKLWAKRPGQGVDRPLHRMRPGFGAACGGFVHHPQGWFSKFKFSN